MSYVKQRRIAVIGGGISGIAAAKVLRNEGFHAIVFEKEADIGGVWKAAYPEVRLQNLATQYRLSDLPWPFVPDKHPTAVQVRQYLRHAVEHFNLDVRVQHEVVGMAEQEDGWLVRYQNDSGVHDQQFDYVVIAVGQYSDRKSRPRLPGQREFRGQVITENEVDSLDIFTGRRTVVVGFGKSAVDMATFAASRSAHVRQLFRTPRWLIPENILGVHFTFALFNRLGTVMMPSWAHPTAAERFLHRRMRPVVTGFWGLVESILRFQIRRHARSGDEAAHERLRTVQPTHSLMPDLRSATAMAPETYYDSVADGRIIPQQGEVIGFSKDAIELKSGESVACDLVVMCVGSGQPTFPFLPQHYRRMLESEVGGAQLYRHLMHPRIPRIGFVGFNHGFLHVPIVEVGTLWLCAHLHGDFILPPVEEMERTIHHIREWKRTHIHYEPSFGAAISTRYQQYLDILLKDLGVSPYRKLPNVVAEVFARYDVSDYRNVQEEYAGTRARGRRGLRPLNVRT